MASLSLLLQLVAIAPVLAFPKPAADPSACPLSKRAAAPYTSQFPYSGAGINGLPGSQQGGILVPANGDTAHGFQNPPSGAFRGPCPGLNTLANHGFLSRDGITTFDELVAGQQNVYNVGYDLAVVLATLGVALDGDIITEKLSIGGDATSQTALLGLGLLGREGGLDTHNTFEADTSLTRNDFFLANGDDHTFNGTLFAMMTNTVGSTSSASNPLYDFKGMALYRFQRYQQSLHDNQNFYFGPKSLLLYGAATFLYELFPSQNANLTPDKATISSFFGAVPPAAGKTAYGFQPERIPPNWTSRNAPYGLIDVATQILDMYLAYPVLFGGNVGPGNFDALGSLGIIQNGKISGNVSPTDVVCLLYQLIATDSVPDSLSGILSLPLEIVNFITSKINPVFEPFGCPLNTNP